MLNIGTPIPNPVKITFNMIVKIINQTAFGILLIFCMDVFIEDAFSKFQNDKVTGDNADY